MSVSYSQFLAGKQRRPPSSGIPCEPDDVHPGLFEFQRHVTAWAVRRGRAAMWLDAGLGKSRCQIEWARQLGEPTIVLAPLTVTHQTITEAAAIGVDLRYVRDRVEAAQVLDRDPRGMVITNYERLHLFDTARFRSVVLDESSVLAPYSGTVKRALVAAFRDTPHRLSCSATPAPNDIEELCNHADFLGVMSPAEMRSTFFIADSRGEFMRYRLKGHAEGAFYDWLASWAIACRTPSDLSFDDTGYILPPLTITDHLLPTDWTADGELFTLELKGITQRAEVRRDTAVERVAKAVELVAAEPGEQWIVWCGLNGEADAATAAIPGAVNVQGSDTTETKADRLRAFARGETRVLVTKPSLAGYGLNFQSCARMVFIGLSDSFQLYYQAIRRCYRFGQMRPVTAHIVLTELESVIAENVRAKERTAATTAAGLVAAIAAENRRELFAGTSKGDTFEPTRPVAVPDWLRTEETV